MATRERSLDRGRARGRLLRAELGRELREPRRADGLSQAQLARAAGTSPSTIDRIERAACPGASVQRLAEVSAVLGLELGVRAFPVGPPIRDAGHVALLARFRRRIGTMWRWRLEVPVVGAGDLRAWDAVLEHASVCVAVEAETRFRDVQDLLRRLALKERDGEMRCVLLVLADTRANRAAARAAGAIFSASFPVPPGSAWTELRAGRDPGGNALLFA